MKRLLLISILLSIVTVLAPFSAASRQATKPSKRAVHHKAHRAGRHSKTPHRHPTGA